MDQPRSAREASAVETVTIRVFLDPNLTFDHNPSIEPVVTARSTEMVRDRVFVLVFAGLMYLTKKRVWAGVAH